MTDNLRKIVDSFIKQMEGVNEKRCTAAHQELQFCMLESKLFNELRENIHQQDKIELQFQVKQATTPPEISQDQ